LSLHFGHSEEFALFEADLHEKIIQNKKIISPPRHKPGRWPRWLVERGVDVIIADGMSMRARFLLEQDDTLVLLGAPSEDPESIVKAYLDGILKTDSCSYNN